MPYDVAKSSGKWKHDSHSDNYSQIMEKFGVPKDMSEKMGKDSGTVFPVENSLTGNTMKTKMELNGRAIENTLTLGEEGEEQGPMGKTRKVTYTMDGDSLVSVYPDFDGNGLHVRMTRHFVDDNTINVDIKVGDDLVGWQVSKRC